MKILLIWPRTENRHMNAMANIWSNEPLNLEYLAAGVKGHDVRILDMRHENGFAGLQSALEKFNPNIVGVTSQSWEASTAKKIMRVVKDFNSSILTVIGGVHATAVTEDCLDEHIDIVVIGEGVDTLREIVERLELGRDFKDVRGIALRDGDKLHYTKPRPYPDLDELPFPDRSLTSHLRHKYRHLLWAKRVATIRTTEGCPFRCDFCPTWKQTGGKYLKRSVGLVVQELSMIEEDTVFFTDAVNLVHRDRATQLAEAIKEAGIKKQYLIFERADSIVKSPDLVRLWRDIGLSYVLIGVEAASEKDLKSMNKNSSTYLNSEALRILEENGVHPLCALMIRPDWDEEGFKEMREYIKTEGIVSPAFSITTPLPGTDFWEKVKDQIVVHNWDMYDFSHSVLRTKLGLKEFYAECEKLFGCYTEGKALEHSLSTLNSIPESERAEAMQILSNYAEVQKGAFDDHEIADLALFGARAA